MRNHVISDALITPPLPFGPVRFKEFISLVKRARPFSEIELLERDFIAAGKTIIIRYLARAKHPRYRNFYHARCTTTYVEQSGVWKIIAHTHQKVSGSKTPLQKSSDSKASNEAVIVKT